MKYLLDFWFLFQKNLLNRSYISKSHNLLYSKTNFFLYSNFNIQMSYFSILFSIETFFHFLNNIIIIKLIFFLYYIILDEFNDSDYLCELNDNELDWFRFRIEYQSNVNFMFTLGGYLMNLSWIDLFDWLFLSCENWQILWFNDEN